MHKNNQGRKALKQGLLRPAVFVSLLAGASVAAPFALPAFAQSYSFTTVKVEGNATVETATVLSYLKIPRGSEISAASLNDAYQRLVGSGLFETVSIDPQGSTLVVTVTEYPTINIVNFEGNKRLKDEDLAGIAKSQSRRVYSPAQAEADAAAIAEAYRQSGRMAATVDPRIIRRDGNRVDLVFEVTEGKVVEIERLSFSGNRAFTDRRLRQVLQTKQAGLLRTFIQRDTFVAERLELDKQLLRDFYLSRGYADVEVLNASGDIARERDAYFVTFSIREGQSYNIGKVSTVSEIEGLDKADFEGVQRIRSGETWSPALIDNNVTRMENLALKKGLNFVRVDPRIVKNERDGTLDVQFAIVRGEKVFVERIDIEGNTTTLDQVIRRQFRTVEGDPFNPREIRQSAERIRALGFFKDAQVNTEPGTASDQVVVNVDVEEQPTGSLSLGASYSVADGVGLNVGFSESNFLGRGQAVSANVTSGTNSNAASFSFVEPAFLGRDVALKFSANYRETDNQNAAYNTQSFGLQPGLEFPISELGRLETRFFYNESTLSGVNVANSSAIIYRDQERGSLSAMGVGYGFSYDTRINGVNPKGGVLLRFGQNLAGLGGDQQYIETTAFALAENKIFKEDVTVRAIFEGGALMMLGDDPSRVTNRYFGNSKIRGFESNGIGPRDLNTNNEDALGGNFFAVARFETEFPLGLPEEYGIGGGLFLDVGSVWGLDDTDGGPNPGGSPVDDAFHLRSAVGVSVLWDTPLGPLRFNFSKALVKQDYDKEQNFDLTISTKF